MKTSVAPVVCVQPKVGSDWDLLSIEGTAMFVSSDGSFITPNHVIEGITNPKREKPCPSAAIYGPEDGIWHEDKGTFRVNYALFIALACKTDKQIDIAYCKPVPGSLGKIKPVPATLDNSLPAEGTPVAFTGFPLSNVIPITSIGSVAAYWATDDLGTFTVVVDKNGWPGASGSPIYLQDGHVIGMVFSRGIGEGTGLTYGRISKFISDFLPKADEGTK